MQSDTDTPTDNVRPFPGAAPESQPRHKADPTSALRSKRYRRARKQSAGRDGRASNSKGKPAPVGQTTDTEKQNEIKPSVTVHVAPPLTADLDVRASVQRHDRGIRFAALVAALALATVSGGFSITGMTSIFVGAYWPVIGMGVALEVGKLSAAAWLGHQRDTASWRLRAALAILVAVLMGLNAVGCYGSTIDSSSSVRTLILATSVVMPRARSLSSTFSIAARKEPLTRPLSPTAAQVPKETKSGAGLVRGEKAKSPVAAKSVTIVTGFRQGTLKSNPAELGIFPRLNKKSA
jgi:hypothetical protein